MKKINRHGFTLAEVLITLTIIGVIAALTIPNLMQSYKKHETEVKLKEAYSILSNAIKISLLENSDLNEFKNQITTSWTDKYIIPYLKVSKDYGVIKMFNDYGYKQPAGGIYNGMYLSHHSHRHLLLQNGMLLSIAAPVSYSGEQGNIAVFLININGLQKKQPQMGKDIFGFSFFDDNKLYSGAIYDKRAHTYEGNAKIECSNSGMLCTYIIMKNGWKIPDDYPVKKW